MSDFAKGLGLDTHGDGFILLVWGEVGVSLLKINDSKQNNEWVNNRLTKNRFI